MSAKIMKDELGNFWYSAEETDDLRAQLAQAQATIERLGKERDTWKRMSDHNHDGSMACLAENRVLLKEIDRMVSVACGWAPTWEAANVLVDHATELVRNGFPLTTAEAARVKGLERVVDYINGACDLDCAMFKRV